MSCYRSTQYIPGVSPRLPLTPSLPRPAPDQMICMLCFSDDLARDDPVEFSPCEQKKGSRLRH